MADTEYQRLFEEVNTSIQVVNRRAQRYRTWQVLLLLVSLVGGLLVTALAGESAMGGKKLPQATVAITTGGPLSDLAPNWRVVCGVMALVNLLATGATAAVNLFKLSEHSTEATLCVGALEALRVELATNTHLDQATVDEVRADYVKLPTPYTEYFH